MKEEAMSPVDLSARVRDVGVQTESWQCAVEPLRALLAEVVLAAMRSDPSEMTGRKRFLQDLFRLSLDHCGQLVGQAEIQKVNEYMTGR
jgi:hypothetical protein